MNPTIQKNILNRGNQMKPHSQNMKRIKQKEIVSHNQIKQSNSQQSVTHKFFQIKTKSSLEIRKNTYRDKQYTLEQKRKFQIENLKKKDRYVDMNGFEISKQKLGKGNNQVYQGIWQTTNVAIKVIQIWKTQSLHNQIQQSLKRGIQQILKMVFLLHPNIIEMYKFSIQQSGNYTRLYLIMKKMKGNLTKYKFKNLKNKIQVIQQILIGLKFLHHQNIIHRDLKPQNILFDQYQNIRICDFGISKKLQNMSYQKTIHPAYTPKYAPRQAYEGILSYKLDIWAFGIIMYEILIQKFDSNKQIIQNMNQHKFPLNLYWKKNVFQNCQNNQKQANVLCRIIQNCLSDNKQQTPKAQQLLQIVKEVKAQLSAF